MFFERFTVSDLLRWFGEQSEAVKLGILGLLGGFSAGFWAFVRELRKPVLALPVNHTTSTAPSKADDPTLLLLAEVTAINTNLALLLAATKSQTEAQDGRIDKVLSAITELAHQVERLRDRIKD